MPTTKHTNNCEKCAKKAIFTCTCGCMLCKKHIKEFGRCPRCAHERKKYEKAKNEGRLCSHESCDNVCDKKEDKCCICERFFCRDHLNSVTIYERRPLGCLQDIYIGKKSMCDECKERATLVRKYEERHLNIPFKRNTLVIKEDCKIL